MTELEDSMRARFRELTATRDSRRSVSGPLRAERDEKLAALQMQDRAIRAEYDPQIREAEDGLFGIDIEIGRIVRFLNDNGKSATGEVGTEADIPQE